MKNQCFSVRLKSRKRIEWRRPDSSVTRDMELLVRKSGAPDVVIPLPQGELRGEVVCELDKAADYEISLVGGGETLALTTVPSVGSRQ